MTIPVITKNEFLSTLEKIHYPFLNNYYAFYSSWLGGITTDPRFMLIPLDDHMVHRGDGVFEACKSLNKSIYLLDAHLERLYRSAEMIHLTPSFSKEEIKTIIIETLKAANHSDAAIRIFLSRGPGNFTVNPYDSIGSQLYVAITELKAPPSCKYADGVTIGISNIPVKVSWLAQVKSCNYLPNVLMKKETIDRGLDFIIALDDEGFITEGATENILIQDSQGTLIYPKFRHTLRGTTLLRISTLAAQQGFQVKEDSISLENLYAAKEIMLTGTTLDILPVTSLEGKKIGSGQPGPVAQQLQQLLLEDIKNQLPLFE